MFFQADQGYCDREMFSLLHEGNISLMYFLCHFPLHINFTHTCRISLLFSHYHMYFSMLFVSMTIIFFILEFYFIYLFLHSRFVLVIYFIHISVYMSIPISQFRLHNILSSLVYFNLLSNSF